MKGRIINKTRRFGLLICLGEQLRELPTFREDAAKSGQRFGFKKLSGEEADDSRAASSRALPSG